MSEHREADGRVVPVTVISVSPCVVTGIRTTERDGYTALQLATGERRNLTKALLGHFGTHGKFRTVREFRPWAGEVIPAVAIGDSVDLTQFTVGDMVTVTGTSKGRGFQGVVKRHGFHGSPKTHGHKDQVRMPGSIGAGGVQHVFKGTRMAGRMGGGQITVSNLKVIAVNAAAGELLVKGAVPGARHSVVLLRNAL